MERSWHELPDEALRLSRKRWNPSRLSGARRSGGPSQARNTDAVSTQLKTGGWHPIEWLCELAGTFFFLFLGFTSIAALESSLSPLHEALPSAALRLVLIVAVFGILAAIVAVSPVGRRSGAHLNPAVTLGFWAHGQTHTHDLMGFVVSQCLGAVLAAAAFFVTSGSWAETANFARTEPRPELSGWAAAGIEVAITFGLVLVVLLMVSSPRTARWTPVGVTAALMVLIPLGGPLTGAGMNPARTLGPDVVSAQYPSLWVYLVGPALGALLAAAAFSLIASGRNVLTAKLFHDERHTSVHTSRLPTGRR